MKPNRLSAMALMVAIALPVLAGEDAEKALFSQKCSSCHGKDAKGNPAMAKMFKLEATALDLTSKATLSKKDEELILTTSKGHGKMPAYEGKLKTDEIKGLVAFIRSLSNPKPK